MDIQGVRRDRLRDLIETRFNGKQTEFIAATDINQGELSGLLRKKSFGERKARSLERILRLPPGWFDGGPVAPDTPALNDKKFNVLYAHFSFLTEMQKDEEIQRIKSIADANRVLLKQLSGKLNPVSDDRVAKHITKPPKVKEHK